MEFKLDDKNEFLKEYYEKEENYYVRDNSSKNKNCIIFFSGNGLYYPNAVETFREVVIENNRFEWENISNSPRLMEHFSRMIFVRDICKTWYVCGINRKVDTIDKLIELLADLIQGYSVTTCGNSAGGYIATVVGTALNAEKVLNFGGQWDISDKDSFFLRKYQNQPERSKYYNIVESSRGKQVFWFYSALCEYDRNELNYVAEYMDEISAIAIKSKFHGDLLIGACYAECLVKSKAELRRVAEKYAGKIVSQRKICGDFLSGKELWQARVNDIINSHKSLYTIRDWMKKVAK